MRRRTRRAKWAALAAVTLAVQVVVAAGPAAADVVVDDWQTVAEAAYFRSPRAAYNTATGDTLVFWKQASTYGAYIQLLTPAGVPKPGASRAQVSEASVHNVHGAAALYNPQANNYLLIYPERYQKPDNSWGSHVISQTVSVGGVPGPKVVLFDSPTYVSSGLPLDAAYDHVNNRYFVVAWEHTDKTAPGERGSQYNAALLGPDGHLAGPVLTGSEGYIVSPQTTARDVHALGFDAATETFLYVYTEYSEWGDTGASPEFSSWLVAEQFDESGARKAGPRVVEAPLDDANSGGYYDVQIGSHPSAARYLIVYTTQRSQFTQSLAPDGSKIGSRHATLDPSSHGFPGPFHDAVSGGWLLFNGRNGIWPLDLDGAPSCPADTVHYGDAAVAPAGDGRFLTLGAVGYDLAARFVESQPSGAAAFVPAPAPFRAFDSRPGELAPGPKGTVGPNGSVRVQVRGVGSVPDSPDVSAVVVNLTVIGSSPSFASAYAAGGVPAGEVPAFSNLNLTAQGQVRPNLAIVPVADDGAIEVFTSAASEVLVDVTGWFEDVFCVAAAGRFVPVDVARVFDSREGEAAPGPKGHLAAGQKVTVQIAGAGGVPTDGVSAVALAVVATNTDAPGFVTVAPAIAGTPATSLINLNGAGETAPNSVLTPLSPAGTVDVYVSGGADVAIDVSGYFTDDTAEESGSGLFVPVDPTRIFDSRPDTEAPGPKGLIANNGQVTVALGGVGPLPSLGVAALAVNLGAVAGELPGFATAWSGETASPDASSVNFAANDVRSAAGIVPVSASSMNFRLRVLNSTHLFADVSGYFAT